MKLQDWLTSKNLNVYKFCRYHSFCEESVYGYVKGNVPRAHVAVKIVKATGGEVSLEDLGLPTATIAKLNLKRMRRPATKEPALS